MRIDHSAFDQSDPDIEQAIEDFTDAAAEIRVLTGQQLNGVPAHERAHIQARITELTAQISLRAERIGNISGAALLDLVNLRLTEKSRRGRPAPARETIRTAQDAVIAATGAEAEALKVLQAAQQDLLAKRAARVTAEEAYHVIAAGRLG